ncbi:hypothetical protein ACSLBF_08405 [Pseudoalteromonas sp. T1lg65]|uniref:hypothetical protein n=1 Tax=Pseudoalteromonas sp. T1lg65 TaxID=2077101 RepID=UPI003F7B2EB7
MKVNTNQVVLGASPADNSPAQITKSGSEAALSKTLSTLEPDVYHGTSTKEPPVTYERPFNIGESVQQVETVEQTMDRVFEASSELYMGGNMFRAADAMTAEYDNFMSELSKTNPELAAKNWGFSVDPDGKIAVSGQLSEKEAQLLTDKLNGNEELVQYANDVKESFLKYTALERGPEGNGTSKYWGKYDVNNDNFGDVINMRAVIELGRNQDPENIKTGDHLHTYNFVEGMAAQLQSNAEVKYSA